MVDLKKMASMPGVAEAARFQGTRCWHAGRSRLLMHAVSSRSTDPSRSTDIGTRRRRVLIADDDALVRGSLAAVLEYEGFLVDEAADGSDAVAQATAHAPDLVLLDLNMPAMDGWTAFRKLDHIRPLVPMIVITARPHQYKEAVRLGVDAFMEKPLSIPVLVHAIKRLSSEEERHRTQRITNRTFVTTLLDSANPSL